MIATAGLLLAVLTPTAAHAGTTPAAPAVGSCYTMTWREIQSMTNSNPVVSCDGPHQALTVAVPTLPSGVDRTDASAVARRVFPTCAPAIAAAVGGWRNYLRSLYGDGFFVPTQAQWDQGARWVRCDLLLFTGGRALQNLPARPGAGLTDRATLCRAGRTTGYAVVPCSRRHQYRATTTIRMSAWNGTKAAKAFAARACLKRFPSGDFFTGYPRTRAAFDAGYRFAVCVSRTTA
jgi:hypothetical protein